MTEYYDREDVNSIHAVLFKNTLWMSHKYYYDFDTEEWIKCYKLDRLPYGLITLQLDNGKTNNQCVVTCEDSYRLADFPEEINSEFMLNEKKWRDEIVKAGAEFDWLDENETSDCWVKGKVCWTKADIVPGVVLIGPREHPNLNSFGYFYKESKRFAKSCSYTRIITEEELLQEEEDRQQRIKKLDEEQKMINELSKKIGLKCCKKYIKYAYQCLGFGKMSYIDTIEYYKTLTKNPEEITKMRIAETLSEDERQKFLDTEYKSTIGLIGLVSKLGENYDVVFDSGQQVPEFNKWRDEHYVCLTGSDGIFDIVVHGANYAYLYCGDSDPHNEYERKIPLEKNESNNTFTFTDITLENPLFLSASGSRLEIYTDGKIVTYKSIWIKYDKGRIINKFGNSYAISHFPKLDRILFNGHAWQPSFSSGYQEIVDIPFEDEEQINRDVCRYALSC